MLHKVLLGSGVAAWVPIVKAAQPMENEPGKTSPPLIRPSDLPIYEAPQFIGEYTTKAARREVGMIRQQLMEPVRSVRVAVQGVVQQTDSALQSVRDNYNEFQDRTDWIVKYLREEENKNVRYGAVAMGGLTGFIFGLRGGFIRRVFYASIGTTLMGAVCFPEETKEVFTQNGALAKRYVNIAYNFAYGVKPGDPQLELKLPELHFPQNLSELVDLSASVASSIKQLVLPPAKEASPQETKDKKQ